MEKAAGNSLWESSYVMHWAVNADRLTSAAGEGEDSTCSSISTHSSSFPFFHLTECWCLDSWTSEKLENGTARLPWAFLKQPVPGWFWPSEGTGWPSTPKTTLTPSLPWTVSLLHSSCPPLLPLWLTRLQPGMAGVPQVQARLSWTLSAFSTQG